MSDVKLVEALARRLFAEIELLRPQAAKAVELPDEPELRTLNQRSFVEALDVHPTESVEFDTNGQVHLVGDEDEPGADHYYGTDGDEVKGFHPLPVGADVVAVKESIEYAVADGKLHLVGDADAPGNSKVYGTNTGGVKGWQDFATMWEAVLAALATSMTSPGWVLGRKSDGGAGFTYGWVATVTHASQHPES